ncbi:MAG: hypothetical protein CME70_13485 [Halobacteriovorax sp.]|nr:hypothetical protein [Halobacteriovorax sp.]|tara:strand:- start:25825 stop:26889 length:1065 start_codon:yes stop_codon:yes gene_type:complete
MKKLIAVSLMGLSFGAMAEAVDYKHCKTAFNPAFGPDKTFPFVLGDDGKVKAHKDVKYKFDSKTKVETMTYKGHGYGGPGTGNEQEILIKRDEDGTITQVIYNSKFPGVKTKTGLGAKNPFFGMGMPGPGVGIGYPGGGFGGYGGMYAGPTKSSTVFDVKVKDGKCFPYRNVGLFESAGNTHKTFNGDIQLCYDINKMLKEEAKEGSKANKLKQCYDDYQKQSDKILKSHLKRNDDLYNPKDADEVQSPWGSGGYFGNLEEGEFSDGAPAGNGSGGSGGYGYGYAGGFAGSIDNIVQNQMFNPAQKVKMLSAYCSFPYGGMKEMLEDEGLFKEEPKGGEGSGGGTAKKDKSLQK